MFCCQICVLKLDILMQQVAIISTDHCIITVLSLQQALLYDPTPAGGHGRILLRAGRFLALCDDHPDPRVQWRNHILPTPRVVFLTWPGDGEGNNFSGNE